MKDIFAQRLRNARIMKGLSLDNLCEEIGHIVSKQTINKYEHGTILPSSNVLLSLSKALSLNIDYFFRPFTYSISNIEFRKNTLLPKKVENSVREKIKYKVEKYCEIEEILSINEDFVNPIKDFKINTDGDVVKVVNKLKDVWQLGYDGICDIINVLEEHNIIVIDIPAEVKKFDGISAYVSNGKPIICVNSNANAERMRFTILHELGHILLNLDKKFTHKQEEYLCNLFANEMLISGKVFKNLIGNKRHDISAKELQAIQIQFGISIDALMYKAKYMNIISENRYKYYNIKKQQSPALKKLVEQSLINKEPISRYSRLIYKALSSDLITFSKASYFLEYSVEQIHHELNLV